jgi:hypothetical protein
VFAHLPEGGTQKGVPVSFSLADGYSYIRRYREKKYENVYDPAKAECKGIGKLKQP